MDEWILVFDTETTGVGPDYKNILSYEKANELSKKLAAGIGWTDSINPEDFMIKTDIVIPDFRFIKYEIKQYFWELFGKHSGVYGIDKLVSGYLDKEIEGTLIQLFEKHNKRLDRQLWQKIKRNIRDLLEKYRDIPNFVLWDRSRTYIAQLSYIMYNLRTNKYELYNKFITDIPDEVISYLMDPSRIAKTEEEYDANPSRYTHPISVRTLQKMFEESDPSKRATISDAIEEFIRNVARARVVVAHNAEFDRRLIFCELSRKREKSPESHLFDEFLAAQEKMYCTMCISREIAYIDTKLLKGSQSRVPYFEKERVVTESGDSRLSDVKRMKYPALWEVYDRMFGYPPDESALHDALVDVVVCLRVFYRLWMTGNQTEPVNFNVCGRGDPDIYGKDVGGEISTYIDGITPEGIDPQGNYNPAQGLGLCFTEGKPYDRIPKTTVLAWDHEESSRERIGGKRQTKKNRKTKRKSNTKKR